MNQIEKEFFGLLDMTHEVRDDAIATIGAADLVFRIEGCKSLGEVLQDLGDIESMYTQSFKTMKQDFFVRAPGRENVTSGEATVAWLHGLDGELKAALSALSDEDLAKPIDRGGWQMPVLANFHTYREAVLIQFGKLDCYLRALGKDLPDEWAAWVG
ncbi:MAG: DinB family protein [Acidimicrobiia bacterium]|nr:DinB family protein [Acidimicrobiia bacterium]